MQKRPRARNQRSLVRGKRMTFMSNIKTEMSLLKEDAFALTQAALEISQAQESNDEKRLAAALDNNLQLWVGIRTLVERDENPLPSEVKENLSRLSHFVAQKTFEMQDGSNDKTLEALANTNLQSAERPAWKAKAPNQRSLSGCERTLLSWRIEYALELALRSNAQVREPLLKRRFRDRKPPFFSAPSVSFTVTHCHVLPGRPVAWLILALAHPPSSFP